MYENGLLKEEVQSLHKELENWKEACRKQVERKLHTLVEAADLLEGSPPTEDGEEEERVVCPMCGEIFYQTGYKVIVCAFVTQQPILATVEEQRQEVEVRDVEIIPGVEKGENAQLQSQPAEEENFYWKDGEAPQEQL